jgi:hypothetical protein
LKKVNFHFFSSVYYGFFYVFWEKKKRTIKKETKKIYIGCY